MERRRRLLLIDDDIQGAEIYALGLTGPGCEVEIVHSAEAAFKALHSKSYDAAIVDMHLSGPAGDLSGGRSVLRAVQSLREPVATIILTSQKSPQLAADLLQDLGATRFVSKHTISEQGLQPLMAAIDVAIKQMKPAPMDVIRDMAGNEPEELWVHVALMTLNPDDGYRGLSRFLTEFVSKLSPLRSLNDQSQAPLHPNSTGANLEGLFWSKRLGCAVAMRLGKAQRSSDMLALTPPEGLSVREIVHRHVGSGVEGIAWSLSESARSNFVA